MNLKKYINTARDYRELFSYKFPAQGFDSLKGAFPITINQTIDYCRLLCEIAQLNSQILQDSFEENAKADYKIDPGLLERGYKYPYSDRFILDDDDIYRLSYIRRKQNRPYSLFLTMSEGMVEDYFGSWCSDAEIPDEDEYNPDKNWRLIFPVP